MGVILPKILRTCPQSSSEIADTVVPPLRMIFPAMRASLTSLKDATPFAMIRFPSAEVNVN
jgi:hypothetical protein